MEPKDIEGSMPATIEDEMSDLEQFAMLFFKDEELIVMAELDAVEFKAQMEAEDGPLYTEVTRGRLRAEAEIRASIIKLAIDGSNPAQQMAVKLVQELKLQ